MPEAASNPNKNWYIFLAVSALLIANFLNRFFLPAHEYPMRPAQVMDIAIDTLLLVSLVGMRMKAPFFQEGDKRGIANLLFYFALAAGIGIFLIRFSSDAAWWTGHRLYWLTPR